MLRVTRAALAYGSYLLEKVHESHADERRRISRELHNRVAHSIVAAFRSLELFEMYKTRDPSKAHTRLELAKSTTREALEITRLLSRELRSTSAEEGLEVTLTELLQLSVPQGVNFRISVEGDEALIAPQVVRDELFLILREGIRNAVTHSQASTIAVKVNITEEHIRAAVEDDGRGLEFRDGEPSPRGTGITSIRERTALLGGAPDMTTAPDRGTRIEILLPLPRGGRS